MIPNREARVAKRQVIPRMKVVPVDEEVQMVKTVPLIQSQTESIVKLTQTVEKYLDIDKDDPMEHIGRIFSDE